MSGISVRTIALILSALATTASADPVPRKVSYCDLSQHPQSYVGLKIVVWAARAPSLNGTEALFDDDCADRRSMMFRAANDSALTELMNYRVSEETKDAPFRIWGDFVGEVVNETPVDDPYIDDNGFHFVVTKMQNVKAINLSTAVMDRMRRDWAISKR